MNGLTESCEGNVKIPIKLKTKQIPISLKTPIQSLKIDDDEEENKVVETTITIPIQSLKIDADGEENKVVSPTTTITITFGDQAENHHGMQKLGQLADAGFSIEDLMKGKGLFESKGYICELIDLNSALERTNIKGAPASLLIVRGGLQCLLMDNNFTLDDMFQEQINLEWDSKALMYKKVVNKKARHNLCYGEDNQEPDYESGKGRIVAFSDLPCTNTIRVKLSHYLGDKAKDLMAEGNLYYDISKCGIGFHGDAERKKVIAMRLGASLPLHYQWFQQSKPIGKRIELILHHGDLYVMSEKATGHDWKLRKIPTLRHAAGCQQYLTIK